MEFSEYHYLMSLALEEAYSAQKLNEVPVGAVICDSSGKLISKAHNIKESDHNSCGHAEILAIREAGKKLDNWRIVDCSIFVTLEPCPMCLDALRQCRIKRVVFGAYDLKGGALSLGYNLHRDPRLNHQFDVIGGVLHKKCSKILSDFFREKRKSYKMG